MSLGYRFVKSIIVSVEDYTENYTRTKESPKYQFGDITKTTAIRAWNGVAGTLQKGIIAVVGAEGPAMNLMRFINMCRTNNELDALEIDEGRGKELWDLLNKRFTPIYIADFSAEWFSSEMDGDDVWTMPKFKAFRILLPYLKE